MAVEGGVVQAGAGEIEAAGFDRFGRGLKRRPKRDSLADPRVRGIAGPLRIDGELAGRVTSGGYGYTVERSIAYAYVPSDHAEPGQPVEVEIFGDWVAGQVAAEPLWDPGGERLRA